MSKLLAMFPGQGAQFIGMGKSLLEDFPYTKHTFEEAEDSISVNLRKLCFDGPEEDLKLTANQQPSILTVSSAYFRVLKDEAGLDPDYFAGHSLGEYSALVASGKLDFALAVKLVRLRGEAMQMAVPEGVGAMAAIMGNDLSMVEKVCQGITGEGSKVVEVVNYNSKGQWILSGHKEAVESAMSRLKEHRLRMTLLPVSAPFHSSLMEPARKEMEAHITPNALKDNQSKLIANITGKHQEDYSHQHLLGQIDSPVLWQQSIDEASDLGCTNFLDIGPGKIMFNLIRRSLSKDNTFLQSTNLKELIGMLS